LAARASPRQYSTAMSRSEPQWPEMWERVKRFYARMQTAGDPTDSDVDAAYAFFVFCYHLKDWIKNDPTVDPHVRDQIEDFVADDRGLWFAADVANGVKHLTRDRPARIDAGLRVAVYRAGMTDRGSDLFAEALEGKLA